MAGVILISSLTMVVGMGDSGKKLDKVSTTQATRNLITKQEFKEREQQDKTEFVIEPVEEVAIAPLEKVISKNIGRSGEVKRVKFEIPRTEAAVESNAQSAESVEAEIEQEIEKPVTGTRVTTFNATAYDLSVDSCGKNSSHPQYGITRSGYSLKGMSRVDAMSIAVDPKVIPLGTIVYIEFPSPYEHFNGNYTARDTGGAIKGNIVDIFMGDFNKVKADQSVWDFGRRKVKITY